MAGVKRVAALFVDADGPYSEVEGVDLWDVKRDARSYSGPHPVVAHPPCARWGVFWRGSVRKGSPRYELGDDGGCFEAALAAVRTWGGVLEHPANSYAWKTFGLKKPETSGGWMIADTHGGYTCQVWQGHYGHRAAKATWLYALGASLPNLIWGKSSANGDMSSLLNFRPSRRLFCDVPHASRKPEVTKKERRITPHEFRDILVTMARGADPNNRPPTMFELPPPDTTAAR